ncbi:MULTISPECIES: DHA2 family efflux MFS transporter permease subunit [unclassified Crossiella]|uniref:DHA2 family efflux MFS transporter permease subunit n=1 Tax=unclassified Crossiella TaxID=2620835 RepID=UPI0020003EE9|nr:MULTISPECIES: DHA2 family efflux MFS transporter permease subunit [unclassified Crossiella]MCK2240612.1 DHA2 family efflux MFS transporter permease subunit [Crossiella sp. S99.2]MCK2252937.1 DHA2 family efflux MFS transporter permease subunit [Crossiella sp. S99.1]
MTTQTIPRSRAQVIALVLVLGGVLTGLDMTIVNVALKHLATEFGAPLATVGWVVTGYTLALAAVIPVTAWAVGRFGARRVYLAAVGVFLLGSVLAGAAWDIGSLIGFRVLQGLGGGMIMPVSMTILVRAAAPGELGKAMSTMGLGVLIGPLSGPVLGGWLVDEVSWRWMFFLNLPIGAAVVLLALRLFPPDDALTPRRLDLPGLLMLSPGLALVLYGVTVGGEHGDFTAGTLLAIVAGLVLVGGFLVRARVIRDPLIDLGLFRDRVFAAGVGTLALYASGYFGSMFLMPLYFQLARGESATAAGLLIIPAALGSGLIMQVAGRLVDRFPPGRIVLAGITVGVTGILAFAAQLAMDGPYWGLLIAVTLIGVGGGGTMMPTMTAATRTLPPEQAAAGSAVLGLVSALASASGTAVLSVVLTANLAASAPGAAIQQTYLLVAGLVACALLPALMLPRRQP